MEPQREKSRTEVKADRILRLKATIEKGQGTVSHGLAASGDNPPAASEHVFTRLFAYPSLHCRAFWVKDKPDRNRH
jgi:hypothetical protein